MRNQTNFLLLFLLLFQAEAFSQNSDLNSYTLKGKVKSVFTTTIDSSKRVINSNKQIPYTVYSESDSLIFDKRGNIVFQGSYQKNGIISRYAYRNIYDYDSNYCGKIQYSIDNVERMRTRPVSKKIQNQIFWIQNSGDTLKLNFCDSLGIISASFLPELQWGKIKQFNKRNTLNAIFFQSKTDTTSLSKDVNDEFLYYFNSEGLLIKNDYINVTPAYKISYINTYNEKNLLIDRRRMYDDTILTHHKIFKYHSNDTIMEIQRFAYDTCCLIIYKFNNKGKIAEELWFDTKHEYTFSLKDNSLFYYRSYQYDTSGRLEQTKSVNMDDNDDYLFIQHYTDHYGSYTGYSISENDTSNSVIYQYNEKGNLIFSSIDHSYYKLIEQNEFEYDNSGNWIKNTRTIFRNNSSTDSKIIKYRVIEYY